MENSKIVLKDIEEFENHIQRLSIKINEANVEWKDEKFEELCEAIQSIANQSREMIETGKQCSKAIEEFSSDAK